MSRLFVARWTTFVLAEFVAISAVETAIGLNPVQLISMNDLASLVTGTAAVAAVEAFRARRR